MEGPNTMDTWSQKKRVLLERGRKMVSDFLFSLGIFKLKGLGEILDDVFAAENHDAGF